jgi:biotin transport system permease protein
MLTYEPGGSLAHRLDPRTKLFVQIAFVAAAFAHTTPGGLAVLSAVTGALLFAAGTSPVRTLWAYRFVLPFLVVSPLVEGLTFGSPWFVPGDAVFPLLSSYRVFLILLVSAAYVRTTPVRETRAAIQRTVPGRAGQFLGIGVALVFRFLPVLRDDVRRAREAAAARLDTERRLDERMQLAATAGLSRAFGRADRLALALRARCLAWNPTLPALSFARRDLLGAVLGLGLAVSVLV